MLNTFAFHTRNTFAPTQYAIGANTFVFRQAPHVSFPQSVTPKPPRIAAFRFACADIPQSTYRFRIGRDYHFYRDDYSPNGTVKIPPDCYGGFVPPTAPTLSGDLAITLDNVTGVAVGFEVKPVNRNIVREPNCIRSENGTTLYQDKQQHAENGELTRPTVKIPSDNTDNVYPLLCATSENSKRLGLDFCSTTDMAEPLSIISHIFSEIATPIVVPLCGVSDESELLTRSSCLPRQNGTPTNGDSVCAVREDADNDQVHIDKKVVYDINGEPYVPLHTFRLTSYQTVASTKTRIKPIENFKLTFKPIYQDTPRQFDLLEYTESTLFSPVLFYPTNEQYASQSAPNRRWQWLFNDPITVTLNHSKASRITSQQCFTEGGKLIREGRPTCSIQEPAEQPCIGLTPFIDPKPDVPDTPPGGNAETIIVPTKEIYKVKNTIVSTMADGTPIDINNVSLSFDVDSHSWQWSGDLVNPAQENLVKPTSDGNGVVIHLTINTKVWHLLVERTAKTRSFNSTRIGLNGRGISALLDEPYQSRYSVETTSVLSNQQIAESFLPTGAGWTIDWQMPIWNIPAKGYNHRNLTPLQALQQHVNSCGGMIVPKTDAKVIKVIKRYPILPWLFTAGTPDLIVPDDIIIQLTEEPISQYGANGVYIHGLENGGKQGLVRITGSAGDRLAPTVSSNMATDSTAIRTIGERTLAGAYVQPKIKSITTIMDGGTTIDLVDTGTFVEFQVDSGHDRGIVNTVSIDVSTDDDGVTTVGQSLGIGESTNNTFSLFKELIPNDPLILVKLVSTNGQLSTVTTVDGKSMQVRGTGIANANYYVRAGVIESTAPTIPIISETVV